MNQGIEQWIALIILASQTLLTPLKKEVVVDTVSGGACINKTPCQVSRTGVGGSTPDDIHDSVSIFEPPSPVLIVIVGTPPTCGFNASK